VVRRKIFREWSVHVVISNTTNRVATADNISNLSFFVSVCH
jgi:hypothetical protein